MRAFGVGCCVLSIWSAWSNEVGALRLGLPGGEVESRAFLDVVGLCVAFLLVLMDGREVAAIVIISIT